MNKDTETFEIEGWTVRGWPCFDFRKQGYCSGDIDPDGKVCMDPGPSEVFGGRYGGDYALRREVPWNVVLKARQLWEAHNDKP